MMTRMKETIVCESADLPARIAAEFAKYVDLAKLDLRLGTDDIASAYRVLLSARIDIKLKSLCAPISPPRD